VAWFIGQSTIVIVLAFGLGLVVGWLLWARRMRLLTVEVVAARIRAAEHAATRTSYGRRITWTSSGRIALDAHTPLDSDGVAVKRPTADPECDDAESRCERAGESDGQDVARLRDASADRDDSNMQVPHIPSPHIPAPHAAAPHIPAPRIESADDPERGELGFAGFDDDDLDNDYDRAIDDDFGRGLGTPFDPRLGNAPSTSDLRGLDRFRDLFTPPPNGRLPRTPEPRRTEPDLARGRDNDSAPGRDRPAGGNADDTTLAAAGLTEETTNDGAARDCPNHGLDSVIGRTPAQSDGDAMDVRGPDAMLGGDDASAPAGRVADHANDDLTRIDGIGPKAAAALVASGIRSFDDLAAADGDTVATALRAAGVRLTPSVHAWPLAAHRLAVRRIVDAAGEVATSATGLTSLSGIAHGGVDLNGVDLNGVDQHGTDQHGTDRRGIDQRAIDQRGIDQRGIDQRGIDQRGIDQRGIDQRGIDQRGPDPENNRENRRGGLLPKRRSPGTPARRSIPPDALDPDDFARIEGIGPKFAAALVASGIRTFGQLANADESALRRAIGNPQPDVAPSLPTWPTQARLLATGDDDGFAELAARLIAGRSVDDDLERIHGIGPQTAAALRAAGFRTFRTLAASDVGRLRDAIESAGLRLTPRLANWPAQARLLADGDEEGFADLARRMADKRRLGDDRVRDEHGRTDRPDDGPA
jgi:predicted flap endonuclease-1-like 5' DNA nuclease